MEPVSIGLGILTAFVSLVVALKAVHITLKSDCIRGSVVLNAGTNSVNSAGE